MTRGLTSIVLVSMATMAGAQSPMFSTLREVVRVDVLVSSNGQPVKGLLPGDFEVRDNGVLQHVDLAGFEEVPLNVILALDMSDSVAGEKLEHLRSASQGVLSGLKKDDRASLVTFSHIVTQRTELTGDVARVSAALDEAEGSGSTALVDGIYASIMLGEAEPGRTLIIAFSDGVDTSSWLSPEALIDTARRSEAVVYSVSTGKADESPFLRELSQATGGELLEIESTRDLNAMFLRIFNEFRYRYLVSYSPSGVDKAGWHRLQVRVKRGNATVKARPGYQKGS
jgi:VWFA-related protein